MCTGQGSNQGPLDPKSDALTTAPLRHLASFLTCANLFNETLECKNNCPKIKICFGYVKLHDFLGNILCDCKERG